MCSGRGASWMGVCSLETLDSLDHDQVSDVEADEVCSGTSCARNSPVDTSESHELADSLRVGKLRLWEFVERLDRNSVCCLISNT